MRAVGVAAALLSVGVLAPMATAQTDDVLGPGDILRQGKVEFTVTQVGQLHADLQRVTVHTEAVAPVTDAKACISSDWLSRYRECDTVVVKHEDHYDLRIKPPSRQFAGAYDQTTVRYHYTDPDSGTEVSGRRVLTFPQTRLQSPTKSILYLYPKGEGLYDGPGTVCAGDLLRLEGSIYSWDANIGADADFHGAPFMVQFRPRDTKAWSTIRSEPLDGSRDSRPSWGHVQPRGQKSLLVQARTTGDWRIHWPAQVIDGYSFSSANFRLGYSRVTECL